MLKLEKEYTLRVEYLEKELYVLLKVKTIVFNIATNLCNPAIFTKDSVIDLVHFRDGGIVLIYYIKFLSSDGSQVFSSQYCLSAFLKLKVT